MSKKRKNSHIVSRHGPPCHRCGGETDVMQHNSITAVQLSKAFYYDWWFVCRNEACPTTMIMPEEAKVFRGAKTPAPPKRQSVETLESAPWD